MPDLQITEASQPSTPQEVGDAFGAETLSRQRALRAAVLIDALRCLRGAPGAYDRGTRQAAYRWVMSHDTRGPFSFINVCEVLGFDASRLRRSLFQPMFGTVAVDESTRISVQRSVMPLSRSVRRPRRTRLRYAASS